MAQFYNAAEDPWFDPVWGIPTLYPPAPIFFPMNEAYLPSPPLSSPMGSFGSDSDGFLPDEVFSWRLDDVCQCGDAVFGVSAEDVEVHHPAETGSEEAGTVEENDDEEDAVVPGITDAGEGEQGGRGQVTSHSKSSDGDGNPLDNTGTRQIQEEYPAADDSDDSLDDYNSDDDNATKELKRKVKLLDADYKVIRQSQGMLLMPTKQLYASPEPTCADDTCDKDDCPKSKRGSKQRPNRVGKRSSGNGRSRSSNLQGASAKRKKFVPKVSKQPPFPACLFEEAFINFKHTPGDLQHSWTLSALLSRPVDPATHAKDVVLIRSYMDGRRIPWREDETELVMALARETSSIKEATEKLNALMGRSVKQCYDKVLREWKS
ncbi:hypothetical protein HK104_011051 [Borealophlyctis nickersoniae]|nr:hypothetical protein HK104_011051 [Borealophlyctis nickersoniae]